MSGGARVVALDYGAARCGVAVSDPTGTLATPLEAILRPNTRKGFNRLLAAIRAHAPERVVVGLPVSLSGGDSAQTAEARAFAERLGDPSVVVLGSDAGGRVALLVAASEGAVARGVRAGAIVKAAAQVVGGGGGGRDTMAQAGGRDPEKLPEALETARAEIARALGVA